MHFSYALKEAVKLAKFGCGVTDSEAAVLRQRHRAKREVRNNRWLT